MQVFALVSISFHLIPVWGVEPVVPLHQCMQGMIDNGCVAEPDCLHHTFNAGVKVLYC